jgi:hypothetical protein
MHALLSLLTDPTITKWVVTAFIAMIALNVVLHVLVYANPRGIVPYNALPWAFQIKWNLDLDFQAVTYAAVHDKWIARWSHLTLPLEQVAWVILLLSVHPAAVPLVVVLVVWQAALLGEKQLVLGVVAMWAVLAAAGFACLTAFGPAALLGAKVLLLVGPVLRFIGHTFEPIPPFVGLPKDEFIPLSEMPIRPAVIALGLGGIVSEFAAALPHRLIVVQLFWLAQQMGYQPRRARPWSEAAVLGAAIRSNGWKAYDKTRHLLLPDGVPLATGAADV